MQREAFLNKLETGKAIQKPQLLELLKEQYPCAQPSTLDWHIHSMMKQGQLVRQGRGCYLVLSEQLAAGAFEPCLPDELGWLGKRIRKQFPLLTTCLWTTASLHSFTTQQPLIQYWMVETERDAVDVVLDFVSRQTNTGTLRKAPVLKAEDLKLAQQYNLERYVTLVVKPLISEAPLGHNRSGLPIPTPEKILVDLVSDTAVFDSFAEELPHIFSGFNGRFVLNQDRLRRYARRRHKLATVNNYLSLLPSSYRTIPA